MNPPRRLYFVRHGRADREAWAGADFERPLTAAGTARLRRQAAFMTGLDLDIDLVVSSPLVRARQTAEIVAAALAPADGVRIDDRLGFRFTVDLLAGILQDAPSRRLLLVGHEPGFSTVIGAVTGGSWITVRKASLVRVDLLAELPPQGTLEWSIPPRAMLGPGG